VPPTTVVGKMRLTVESRTIGNGGLLGALIRTWILLPVCGNQIRQAIAVEVSCGNRLVLRVSFRQGYVSIVNRAIATTWFDDDTKIIVVRRKGIDIGNGEVDIPICVEVCRLPNQ